MTLQDLDSSNNRAAVQRAGCPRLIRWTDGISTCLATRRVRRTARCPCRRRCTAWPGPSCALRRFISCSSVVSTRAPDAPIGWPIAIAPPFTFTLLVSQPMSLLTAQACAANASLASIRSRSCGFQPAFSSARRLAGIGPVPMIAGSTPACAQITMRASGLRPRRSASFAVISTSAAAPSLRPEALPAVTRAAFGWNAGCRPAELLGGGVAADELVLLDDGVALLALDHDL